MQTTSYTPGATGGNREWLDGPLTILEPEETPFVSSIKKANGAKGTYHEFIADKLDGVRIGGTKEGDSGTKAGNKAAKRQRFGSYLGRYMRPWSVTDVQQAISENGGLEGIVADEADAAKAKSVRELKRDLEAACLSSLDGQGGSDDAMRMRGAFSWLASSQTPSVPADFACPAAQRITGQSTLLESGTGSITAVLQSLFTTTEGRRTYDAFIGADYIADVDGMTRTGPEISSGNTRVVYDGEKAKTIRLNVEMFDCSFGVLAFVPDVWLNIATDGGTGDGEALLIARREHWEIAFLEALHSADDGKDAGGLSGYVKCIGGLGCRMPKGSAFIQS